jgi:hypothetical protein
MYPTPKAPSESKRLAKGVGAGKNVCPIYTAKK